MNIAVINIKEILKLAVKIVLLILILLSAIIVFKKIKINIDDNFDVGKYMELVKCDNENKKKPITATNLLNIGLGSLNVNYLSSRKRIY